MSEQPAKPGPRDGSMPFVLTMGGIIVGVIIFILREIIAGETDRASAIPYVIIGGVAGFGLHFLLKRRRSRP